MPWLSCSGWDSIIVELLGNVSVGFALRKTRQKSQKNFSWGEEVKTTTIAQKAIFNTKVRTAQKDEFKNLKFKIHS
jgi:hypothetical protein